MPGVVRQGDKNSEGGAAVSGVSSVLVNNRPIVVDGTPVSPHRPRGHVGKITASGLSNVIAGNKPVNIIGNSDNCGHPRAEGSGDVVAG